MTFKRGFAALFVTLSALTFTSYAQPELDTTFNFTGKRTTPLTGFSPSGTTMVVQPDNKIIVVGYAGSGGPDFVLARYTADGGIDDSFDTDGIVTTDFGIGTTSDLAFGAALQSDGKIVVVGVVDYNANWGSFGVVRYNPDGSLDSSFGSGGKVVTNVEGFGEDRGTAVAIQPDGKIVVAGYIFASAFSYVEVVIRYDASGTLDPAFGVGGIVKNSVTGGGQGGGARAFGIALQPDNKIVTVGTTRSVGSTTFWDAYAVRYHPNGVVDNSFGPNGARVFTPGADSDTFKAVAIQPDGKVLLGGGAGGSDPGSYLVRLNSNGTPDNTFDGDGRAASSLPGPINAITISPGGRIVTAGGFGDFEVVRFTAGGALDTSFSGDGKLVIDVGTSSFDEAFGIAFDSLGRIVLGGRSAQGLGAVRLRAAAGVGISGRVTKSDGRADPNAIVFLDNGGGSVRAARTNPVGYYRFMGVSPGSYTVTVISKNRSFEPRNVTAFDDLANIDFMSSTLHR